VGSEMCIRDSPLGIFKMEVWLIQNGNKFGPIHDYVIRERITTGDLGADDFVWHEGLAGWTRLGEIELFCGDLERVEDRLVEIDTFKDKSKDVDAGASVGEEDSTLKQENRPALNDKKPRHLVRRFWARWLDLMAYTAVWWLLMYWLGRDIGAAIRNPWIQLSIYIPWFMVEAWMIQKFGTTPGKWLLGLKVRNDDHSLLTLKAAIWRSIRVMITGVGFGWGLLAVLCQAMSWFTTKRIGRPVWDFLGGHQVIVKPLNGFKVAAVVVLFLISLQLQMAVRGPHEQEIILESYPSWEKFFKDGNPWYFPVKD